MSLPARQAYILPMPLLSVIVIARLRGRGVLAGLLLYKLPFTLGHLIPWLAWRELRALLGFRVIAALWAGLSL